jgi:hypothetical protein
MGDPAFPGSEDGLARLKGPDFRPFKDESSLFGAEIGRLRQGAERFVVIKAENTAPPLALQS